VLNSFAYDVEQLKCCGVKSPSDWKKSNWYKNTGKHANENYPESCCKTKAEKCSAGDNPDIYQDVSMTSYAWLGCFGKKHPS